MTYLCILMQRNALTCTMQRSSLCVRISPCHPSLSNESTRSLFSAAERLQSVSSIHSSPVHYSRRSQSEHFGPSSPSFGLTPSCFSRSLPESMSHLSSLIFFLLLLLQIVECIHCESAPFFLSCMDRCLLWLSTRRHRTCHDAINRSTSTRSGRCWSMANVRRKWRVDRNVPMTVLRPAIPTPCNRRSTTIAR